MRISDWSSDVCSSDLPLLKLSTSLPNARLALFSGDAWRIGGEVFANVLHLDDACIRDRLVRTVEPPALHRAAGVACGIEPVDRKSTRLNSSHQCATRMPSSALKKKKTM